jgi:hypothetical protein
MDDQGNVTNEILAIVQTCDCQDGTAKHWQQQMQETHLCSHWQISMKCVSQQGLRVNIPELYAICTEDIHAWKCFGVWREARSLWVIWWKETHMVSKGPMQRVVPYVSVARHLGFMSSWCLPMEQNRKYMSRLICVTEFIHANEFICLLELSV